MADRAIGNVGLSDEHAAMGAAAARRLFHAGISDAGVADPLTSVFAQAAIAELARLQREEAPGSYREALEGAEASAEQFNVDPLQGVSEVVQNADDLGATTVRVALSGPAGARKELLIVHDGTPVRLVDALSMVLPYLSTKRCNARAKGRFGIGLKALVKLGARVSVHSAPYNFEIEANLISPGKERDSISGLYGGDPGETLFTIPLGTGFDEEAFHQWFEDWDSPSLLFLDSVRRVVLFDLLRSSSTFDHRLEETTTRHVSLPVGDSQLIVQQAELSDPADGRNWQRYSVELPVPRSVSRMHKATGPTAPVAAAFVAGSSDLRLFAGLPLRVPSELPYDLNAQFDIDPSRGHVIASPWNEWLLANLVDFLAAAALDRFRGDPRVGWFSIAVRPEAAGGDDEWLATKMAVLVDHVTSEVSEHLRLSIGGRECALNRLVYEDEPLDGLLSSADLERLVPGAVAVPLEIRDLEGRWRRVLEALGVSRAVSVVDALELFDEGLQLGKSDEWCVRLMSIALDAGLGTLLLARPCLRFTDGTVASPRSARHTLLVVEDAEGEPFGAAVGVTKTLALAYRGEDAAEIRAWLRSERILKDAATPDRVLNAVAARARTDPIDIDDDALLLLRDCLARIDAERRREIGQRVGSVVRVRAHSWTKAGQRKSWEHPADCYLPSAIDRDPDSWARAAAHAFGPRWIDRAYAELLRTGGDRDRLAAQALFRILGAEIAPRLRPRRPDDSRYNDPAAVIRPASAPAAQVEALRSTAPRATHLQQDWESPDLDAVIADLAKDKDRSARKVRSTALIAVLNRAWPRLYAGHERARAVHSDYSWQFDGRVLATWVARAASEPWLANQNGVLRPPRKLVLRTVANRRIYGDDRSAYVHGVGEELSRAPAILWLGIKSNPRVSALLDELEALRDRGDTGQVDRVFSLYELLASHIPPGEVSQRALVDDVDVATMRHRFGLASRGGGLILAGARWVSPFDVLRGTPIFGSRRAFVPETPRLLPLWRVLAIPTPTARDALAVLREVTASPDPTDSGVLIDTYRFLAAQVKDLPQAERRKFTSIPLWTGTQWTRSRPLYACEDSAVSDALSAAVPVWRPPCSLRTLGELPLALHVTILDAAALPVAGVTAADSVGSAALRERARAAIELLRDHLAEQDPILYRASSVPWNELVSADIVLAPRLAVEVFLPGYAPLLIPRQAHLTTQPLMIFVANEQSLAAWDGAGTVIAALFSEGDIDKVALAWEAMWRRASEGQQTRGLSLAEEEPTKRPGLDALERQATAARRSRGRHQLPSASPAVRYGGPAPAPPPPPRRLKSIAQLQVASIDRTRNDTSAGRVSPQKRRGLTHDTARPRELPDIQRRGLIAYTPEEREALALGILRLVLGAQDREILDYRHARGIGADAIDTHNRYFELKTATGPPSDEATLTANEAERAYREPERFFLAVVSGLEEGEQTEVRLIERPLETLDWKPQTSVTLSGVLRKPALHIILTEESAS